MKQIGQGLPESDTKAETWRWARHSRKRPGVSGIGEGCTKPWVGESIGWAG